MNPCVNYCYLRFGKQYRPECDEICDYAKAAKKAKQLENELTVWQKRLDNQAKEIDRLTAQRDDYFSALQGKEDDFSMYAPYTAEQLNKILDAVEKIGYARLLKIAEKEVAQSENAET